MKLLAVWADGVQAQLRVVVLDVEVGDPAAAARERRSLGIVVLTGVFSVSGHDPALAVEREDNNGPGRSVGRFFVRLEQERLSVRRPVVGTTAATEQASTPASVGLDDPNDVHAGR
jgi:hypothetical protein